MISTLPAAQQGCLIAGTIPVSEETATVSTLLAGQRSRRRLIVYGASSSDDTALRKAEQLISLGFADVFVYRGGLLEWLLLREVYGADWYGVTGEEPPDLLTLEAKSKLAGAGAVVQVHA